MSRLAQVVSGHGMAAQRETIERYCAYRKFALQGFYTDPAESGSKPLRDRPQGRELALRLGEGDHVVFPKLDRGFRNARDCLDTLEVWATKGVTVHFADLGVDSSSPTGKLFITLLAAFAEWERSRISERIREAMAAARARGVRLGNAVHVYGMTRVSKTKYVRHKEETWILDQTMQWRDRPNPPSIYFCWREFLVYRWCEKCTEPVPPTKRGDPVKLCPVCGTELRRLRTNRGMPWSEDRLRRGYRYWLRQREGK